MSTQPAFDLSDYLFGKNPKNLSSKDITQLRDQLSQLEKTCTDSDKQNIEDLKRQLVLADYPQLHLGFLEISQETEFDGEKARVPKFGVYEVYKSENDFYSIEAQCTQLYLYRSFFGRWQCQLNETDEMPGSFFIPILRSIFGPFNEKKSDIQPLIGYCWAGRIVPEKEFEIKYGKGLSGRPIKNCFYGSIPKETLEKVAEAEKTNYFDGFFIFAETKPEDWTAGAASENKIGYAPKNAIIVGTQKGNAFCIDKFNASVMIGF